MRLALCLISTAYLVYFVVMLFPNGPLQETGAPPQALLCRQENCTLALLSLIEESNHIECALFDLSYPPLIDALARKGARIVTDDRNKEELLGRISQLRWDAQGALMHNKFCVFDERIVWTGSFNPTLRADTLNDNNALLLRSRHAAKLHHDEFTSLWNGDFGNDKPSKRAHFTLNTSEITIAFCPEDHCEEQVLEQIRQARSSTYFMVFSFTSQPITDLLINKSREGVEVRGVLERSQRGPYSTFERLTDAGLARGDGNSGAMHHKVFIIDGEVIITGSYNPTKSGDARNDENVVIVRDRRLAAQYLEEFTRVYAQAT